MAIGAADLGPVVASGFPDHCHDSILVSCFCQGCELRAFLLELLDKSLELFLFLPYCRKGARHVVGKCASASILRKMLRYVLRTTRNQLGVLFDILQRPLT